MFVIKRSGETHPMKYDAITERNKKLAKDLIGSDGTPLDVAKLSQQIIQGLKSGMTTVEIDELAAETAAHMSTYEPVYDILAARIAISNLHKSTNEHFVKTMKRLHDYASPEGRKYGIISDEAMKFMSKHREELEYAINYERDFNYTYFGFKTLEKSYLHRIDGKVIERPQHMLMRVAVGIHGAWSNTDTKTGKRIKHEGNIEKVINTYNELSLGKFTHATPTLYNACSTRPQLSSCFLLHMEDDLNHIYETNLRCALISKYAGGIGVDISKIRAKGSKIHSTNGTSDGIVPMVKVFNATATYCNQSGRRKGSISMYLQPWHPDIFDFLQLRFNAPPEELRARDIFLAMWIPDIFMKRVENDEMWSLICPSREPKLNETYGDEFDAIYLEAESKGLYTRQVKAREIWEAILKSQEETGLPYMLYKDSINKKSNQKNIGIIRSSNLCVAGYIKIFTKEGYKAIEDLENKNVDIWNGTEWSNVKVVKTNTNQELYRVKTANRLFIDCTAYHKFPILNDDNKTYTLIECKDLKPNMKLLPFTSLPKTSNRVNNDWDYYKNNILNTPLNSSDDPIFTSSTNISMQYQEDGTYDLSNDSILSVQKLKFKSDVYCVNEPKRNLVMFNGILTGNCTEITEVTSADSVAVCNLASVALPKYVENKDNEVSFDYVELGKVVEIIVENLNNIIDRNFYPVKEAERNNLDYRPIGIGVQGLADVFAMFNISWESDEAKQLNRNIFETIYYHAVKRSNELALRDGSYSAFVGSPASKGELQYHLWSEKPVTNYDWKSLEESVKNGLRNSLLIAPMPTASTAQILGNNEAFEPFTSNIYSRSVLAGDFVCVNRHLYNCLKEKKLWNKTVVDKIIAGGGSVQNVREIPEDIRKVYKTVWEISQKTIIDMAADRGAFIDQSQSMNIFIERPTKAKLTSMHFYGWRKGLKTGSYYIRSKPSREAVKFTIDKDVAGSPKSGKVECKNEEGCLVCSA